MTGRDVLELLEGQETIVYRRYAELDEYVRLTPGLLCLHHKKDQFMLWRGVVTPTVSTGPYHNSDYLDKYQLLAPFVRQWYIVFNERRWHHRPNIPTLREVVTVVHSILYPDYWRIYFLKPGQLIEEATPIVRREFLGEDEHYDS